MNLDKMKNEQIIRNQKADALLNEVIQNTPKPEPFNEEQYRMEIRKNLLLKKDESSESEKEIITISITNLGLVKF